GIETLEVDKNFPDKLFINVITRTPSLIYKSDYGNYLLDDNGIVAQKYDNELDDENDGSLSMPVLIDNNERIVQIGKILTSAEFISNIDIILSDNASRSFVVENFQIPELHCPLPKPETIAEEETENNNQNNNTNENTNINININRSPITNTNVKECDRNELILNNNIIYIKLDIGPIAYLSTNYPILDQLNKLDTFIKNKRGEASAYGYIDVRFPDHVYYQ
ncbi:hypothetical protein ACFL04_05060, partial [Patescibacteria group bacterium]